MPRWSAPQVIAVMAGGAAGAGLRWAVLTTIPPGRFPWPVLAINVLGSVLLGVLLAVRPTDSRLRRILHDAGAIGFCGGLTTFSTFALEVVDLARAGEVASAGLYASASVVGAIGGVILGAASVRLVGVDAAPLEEEA